MSQCITIITPEIARGSGGLADYTLRVIEHWPREVECRILSRRPTSQVNERLTIDELPQSRGAIAAALGSTDGPLLLQYSAYGYDPSGAAIELIDAAVHWKAEATTRRLVIMFHEIWTFVQPWNRNFLAQRRHRRAIGRLAAAADVVFTSTGSQADHLMEVSGRSDVQLLPVGSNIAFHARDEHRTPGTAVLFGREHSRLRALARMQDRLRELAKARHITRLVTVGGGFSPGGAESERSMLSRLDFPDGFEQLGEQSEGTVASVLASASFGISDQDPLSYAKSGTLMAYAQHGLNVLSPFARRDAAQPFSLFVSPDQLTRGVSAAELSKRAKDLQAWQERTSSWRVIADRLLASLEPAAR